MSGLLYLIFIALLIISYWMRGICRALETANANRDMKSLQQMAEIWNAARPEPPHHCAPSDYEAMIAWLLAIESGLLSPRDTDWRTKSGVLAIMLEYATHGQSGRGDGTARDHPSS